MTCASLFSGVLGADMGLEGAGMRPIWACENDEQKVQVIRYRRPELHVYRDVTTLDPETVEAPDVLWMSPPCQDLSVAGKRAGLAGARSGLFYDAIRIAQSLSRRGTRWVLMEQVPGLLSSHRSNDIRAALQAFWDLGGSVAYRVLNSEFFGVPQRRRRLYFVVDLRGERAIQVLALAQGLRGDPAPSREAGQRAAASLTAGSHPGSNVPGRRREDDVNLVAQCLTQRCGGKFDAESETFVPLNEGVAGTLGASGAGTSRPAGQCNEYDFLVADQVASPLRAKHNLALRDDMDTYVTVGFPSFGAEGEVGLEEQVPALRTDANPMAVAFQQRIARNGRGLPSETAHCLRADAGVSSDSTPLVMHETPQLYSIMPMNSGKDYKARESDVAQPIMGSGPVGGNQGGDLLVTPCFPIDAQAMRPGEAKTPSADAEGNVRLRDPGLGVGNEGDPAPTLQTGAVHAVNAGIQVRRLTPVECSRLQYWPDDWTEIGMTEDGKLVKMSDSARYRMAGDGVTSSVAFWLAVGVRWADGLPEEGDLAAIDPRGV